VQHEYEDMKNVFFINRFLSLQAKEALNSVEVDHHRLRIDYSVTKRAHTPSNYFQLLIFITVFFVIEKHREFIWVFVQHLIIVQMAIAIVVRRHQIKDHIIDDIIIIIVVMIIHLGLF
jgi:hypothetical protein